jgi:hypothetical protein
MTAGAEPGGYTATDRGRARPCSRHAPSWRDHGSRGDIALAYPARGVRSFWLALWPTVRAAEAVVRRRATSATRQCTIEANRTD